MDFDPSNEVIEGWGYGMPCIELSVGSLVKVGGGPGGEAA